MIENRIRRTKNPRSLRATQGKYKYFSREYSETQIGKHNDGFTRRMIGTVLRTK